MCTEILLVVQRGFCPYSSARDCDWLLWFFPLAQIWVKTSMNLIKKKKKNVIQEKSKVFSKAIDAKADQLPPMALNK